MKLAISIFWVALPRPSGNVAPHIESKVNSDQLHGISPYELLQEWNNGVGLPVPMKPDTNTNTGLTHVSVT